MGRGRRVLSAPRARPGVLALALALALAGAGASAEERWRLAASGVFAMSGIAFRESRTFTEFAETGRFDAAYETERGPGLEAAVHFALTPRLGIAAAFTAVRRDRRVSLAAELPHPLYLGRPRSLQASAGGLSHRESAFHVDLAWRPMAGRIVLDVLAGLSVFRVTTDIVDHVQYDQTYPYDSVSFVSAPPLPLRASPVGYNLEASADRRIGRRLALGAQVRYSHARAHVQTPSGQGLSLAVGGLQLGAGVRVYF